MSIRNLTDIYKQFEECSRQSANHGQRQIIFRCEASQMSCLLDVRYNVDYIIICIDNIKAVAAIGSHVISIEEHYTSKVKA